LKESQNEAHPLFQRALSDVLIAGYFPIFCHYITSIMGEQGFNISLWKQLFLSTSGVELPGLSLLFLNFD